MTGIFFIKKLPKVVTYSNIFRIIAHKNNNKGKMKMIRLQYDDYKVYNPIKGDVIIDGDDCNDSSPSLIAYWHSACFPEATINNKKFAEKWNQYIIDINDMPDSDYLETFLQEYDDNSEWIVYVIDSSGMTCGLSFDTFWLVVDKNTIVEEI